MIRRPAALLALVSMLAAPACVCAAAPSAADLSGTWAGYMTHAGERQPVALTLEPDTSGHLLVKISIPIVRFDHVPMALAAPRVENDSLILGPFRFRTEPGDTLSGNMPHGFIPRYDVPMRLGRAASFDVPQRAPMTAPLAVPVWTYEAGSPLWAGPTFANGSVYVGTLDGRMIALDAGTGAKRWEFRTGGAVRARPVIEGGALYVQADDGKLYRLDATTGREVWSVRVVAQPVVRRPFSDPKTRYDRFSSAVCTAGKRLYVGTHDGTLMAFDAATGRTLWSFAAGDAILAAPALAGGVLYAGSFDRHVYAVDAATGKLRWKRDTGGAVVSTPAVAGGRVIVGDRAYDLLGLDAATGSVRWTKYLWMSWIESSAVVRDGVAYVGSAEAAGVYACDAASGRSVWSTDVGGWSWGQPAVTQDRVYACTSAQAGYPTGITGGVFALDRATGAPVWRYAAAAPDTGSWGFPGSPAFGGDRVFATSLDGRVLAFDR